MTRPVDFVFVVRQRNNPPYNETLRTNSSYSAAHWLTSRIRKEPKSQNPNEDFVLTIHGRRYEWSKVWVKDDMAQELILEEHLGRCLELDKAFYD